MGVITKPYTLDEIRGVLQDKALFPAEFTAEEEDEIIRRFYSECRHRMSHFTPYKTCGSYLLMGNYDARGKCHTVVVEGRRF